MSPQNLLTQDEIEALLELVESGRSVAAEASAFVAPPSEGPGSGIEANGADAGADGSMVIPRDFTKPDRLPRDESEWVRGEAVHAAVRLSEAISAWLKMDIRVECIAIETLQYGTFLQGLAAPCLVYPFKCGIENKYTGVVSLDPSLVLATMDRVLGGRGTARFTSRALSTIEQPMGMRLMSIILKALSDGLGDITHIEPAPAALPAAEVRQARFIDPGSNIIIITFSISGEVAETELRFALPVAAYPTRESRKPAPKLPAPPPAMSRVEVDVAVKLGDTELTIRELLNLEAGDVIALRQAQDEPSTLEVEGVPVASGRPGSLNRNIAFSVGALTRPQAGGADRVLKNSSEPRAALIG